MKVGTKLTALLAIAIGVWLVSETGSEKMTLPRALTVSVPLILDASAASCLQKRILSLTIPYFHTQK